MGDNDAAAQPGSARQQSAPPSGFAGFFRSAYRQVVQTVIYAGATETEADEAAAAAMEEEEEEEVLRRWDQICLPRAYARKAGAVGGS